MKNWIILVSTIASFSAQAQVSFQSFEDVLRFADAHAIAIKASALNEQIAQTEKKEVQSSRLPSLHASLGYTDNITLQPALVPAQFFNPTAPEGELQELTFGTKYQYNWGLQAQWDVVNFQRKFAVETTTTKVEEMRWQTEVSRFNVYQQLASTYYAILLTQESIQIYTENLSVSEAIYTHTQDQFRNGLVTQSELNLAEIKVRQNRSALASAKNNYQQFYTQLQHQLNTTQDITIHDDPDAFILDSRTIASTHPEIKLEEVRLQQFESVWKQQKAAQLPTLSLVYQNNKTFAVDNFMDFSNTIEQPQQLFGVSLNLINFGNFNNRHRISKSKKQVELQALHLENTRSIKEQEDALLQLQWDQALIQLNENKKILALQKENDRHANHRYQAGITSLDQRLKQYEELLRAQDLYLQSLAAFTLSQYQIFIRQHNFQPTYN